ncbi:hypothetical protein ABID58_004376 [Bradyrhizobium sp. S3.2.6]
MAEYDRAIKLNPKFVPIRSRFTAFSRSRLTSRAFRL